MKWLKDVIIPGAVGALLIIALPGSVSAATKTPKLPPPGPGLHTQNVLWDGDDGCRRRQVTPSATRPVISPGKRASARPALSISPVFLRGKISLSAD